MVKVGNSECEFLKLTPLSRIAAMVGAVSGVIFRARRPSGTNRMRLCGVALSANAGPADHMVNPAHSVSSERRMKKLLTEREDSIGREAGGFGLVLLRDTIVTRGAT